MGLDLQALQDAVCRSLCADVRLYPRADDRIAIATPFSFPDGDTFALFAEPLPAGGVRITDCGHTLMHLSYLMNVDDLSSGNRGEIFRRILADAGVQELDGEIFVEASGDKVGAAVFRLSQALTRIHDVSFLTRQRVAATFYDDLEKRLKSFLPPGRYTRNWIVPGKDKAEVYPIDFRIDGRDPNVPLFLFGIPTADKAKLTTAILEHWLREQLPFESMLVFQDLTKIPQPDVARLSNVGGEIISSLDAADDFKRKVQRRAAA